MDDGWLSALPRSHLIRNQLPTTPGPTCIASLPTVACQVQATIRYSRYYVRFCRAPPLQKASRRPPGTTRATRTHVTLSPFAPLHHCRRERPGASHVSVAQRRPRYQTQDTRMVSIEPSRASTRPSPGEEQRDRCITTLSPTQKLCSIRQMLLQAAALVRRRAPSPAVALLVVVAGGRCRRKPFPASSSLAGRIPAASPRSLRRAVPPSALGIPDMFVSLSRLAT